MTRCLVTGGGGFLGQYIVEQLVERGDFVRSLARNQYTELDELGVEQVSADIRDKAAVTSACDSIEVVYHTAAVAGIGGPWKRYYSINTVGSRNILAGCKTHHVERLIYTSSPSVTFDGSDQLNIDESAPYPATWLCHYPHTKAIAEQEILAANGPQLRTCALRPHLIWGPRDQHLIPRLIQRARSGRLRIVGDGTNLVDMVYVENAAQAHLQAADALVNSTSKARGRAYFISQGEPINCWSWINDILRLAELKPITKRIPLPIAWHIGHMLEIAHRLLGLKDEPRMTRFLAAQLATSHYFDISAARNDLGYEPRIPTAEGMQRLANWCVTG